MTSESTRGPFESLRVLELGQYVAVPYAAELLAHGGAEVMKVEPIDGDETRRNAEIVPGEGRQYILKARGKKGIALDLATERGRAVARRLALSCDVVLSNMRPGALERLGLDYEQLVAEHPGLVFGEISAFGTEGPDAKRPGLDVIVSAASGLTFSGKGWEDGVPVGSEAYLTDFMAGMTLAFGVVTALRERDRTGRGQKVSTSLLQASFALQTATANVFEAFDGWKRPFVQERARGTTRGDVLERRTYMPGNRWFYNTYATADGFIALAAPGRLRKLLAEVLGISDPTISTPGFQMPDDPRPLLAELIEQARTAVGSFATQDLLDRCAAVGVPAAPLRFVEEAVMGEGARANGFVHTFDHAVVGSVTMPTVPVNFSHSKYLPATRTPAYGEHSLEVLGALGLSAEETRVLVDEGAVGTPDTSPFR